MQNIRCGVIQLRVRQFFRSPIAGLLLLRDVDTQLFLQKVLQTMAVRIGAHQPARDLGTINRCGQRTEGMIHRRNIETSIMEQLQYV